MLVISKKIHHSQSLPSVSENYPFALSADRKYSFQKLKRLISELVFIPSSSTANYTAPRAYKKAIINYSMKNAGKQTGYVSKVCFVLVCFALFINGNAQQLAFPGAEGFGKFATGGRGGQVAKVTNLNDDGPGSFRQALNELPDQPLTVVFDVSGLIELKSPLVIRRSNLTIAGQTAPGDGICLKGHSFMLNGAGQGGNKGNIIIRFIRSRPGGTLKSGLYGFDMENCQNVIVDHCSFSWANEECAAMYDTKYNRAMVYR
jgi:hypothetical protein